MRFIKKDNAKISWPSFWRSWLRHRADGISYRSLAERVDVSPSALSQAASGRKLSTWNVTRAFVKGCGGDEKVWYEQWSQVRRELNARQTNTTNGQIPASRSGLRGTGRWSARHFRHSATFGADPSERTAESASSAPRVVMLLGVITIFLLTGAIAINGVSEQEAVPASSDSSPVISSYIKAEYQGDAGLYKTPQPSPAEINTPPLTVGPTEELKIVCQASAGTLMRAVLVGVDSVEPEKENDIWYHVIPSNYYISAVYTNHPDGVEGKPLPGQPFGIRIPECKEPY